MSLSASSMILLLQLGLMLTYSAQGHPRGTSWERRNWTNSYNKFTGQTWVSISHSRRDMAFYCAGRLNAHTSKIPCLSANIKKGDEENEKDQTNGIICKLDSRKGKEKWCSRTCEEGIPMLSVIAPGKRLVYIAGVTNSESTVLYGVDKKTGQQEMYALIQGQVFKMVDSHDGVYVCGRGTGKDNKSGMMIARITEAGSVKWHKVLQEGGLEYCLSISAMRTGFSAFVVGIRRTGSSKFSMSVMKLDGVTGEVEWTTDIADENSVLTSGDIIARKGVYLTTLEANSKSKRTNLLIHKLGQGTGIKLWSKSGKNADGVYESGFHGEGDFVYASYNSSGVRISSIASSSTSSLLGDVEREDEIWIQRQEAIMLKAVDTALSPEGAAILWRTNEGGNMIQKISFNHVCKAESKTGIEITRVRTKLKMELPTTGAETVKAGICDIVADAMGGRARIVNDFLMAGGKVTKYEAEMIIRKILEDRDNDGRSYVEAHLALRKRSVLLEGKLTTVGARNVGEQSAERPRRSVTLSGPVASGGKKSVVAEASKTSWWTWWKILIVTVGCFVLGVVVWMVVRRF